MIKFVLFINKQGQTRLAKYYESITVAERISMEGEIVRKCLSRTDKHVFLAFYKGSVLFLSMEIIKLCIEDMQVFIL